MAWWPAKHPAENGPPFTDTTNNNNNYLRRQQSSKTTATNCVVIREIRNMLPQQPILSSCQVWCWAWLTTRRTGGDTATATGCERRRHDRGLGRSSSQYFYASICHFVAPNKCKCFDEHRWAVTTKSSASIDNAVQLSTNHIIIIFFYPRYQGSRGIWEKLM